LAKYLCVQQNYLAPSNLSNLSFLACAEQLNCRTPILAASEQQATVVSFVGIGLMILLS